MPSAAVTVPETNALFATSTVFTDTAAPTAAEKRYDIGNFPSYFETFVEFALADPIYGADLREKLKKILG